MIYQTLAAYYDALVSDDQTTLFWKSKIMEYIPNGTILEVACGSGDMAIAFAKAGYQVIASDISEAMLDQAKQKQGSELVTWNVQDMMEAYPEPILFDGILCLCDSFNYMLEESQLLAFFENAYKQLKPNGCLIFDTHAWDRLQEFQDEYLEEGTVLDVQYEWSILAQEERLYQNFIFFEKNGVTHLEQHIQRVYQPACIEKMLRLVGFQSAVFTDFKEKGIQPGEKYFYIARKESI